MRSLRRVIQRTLAINGIDLSRISASVRGGRQFCADFTAYRRTAIMAGALPITLSDLYIALSDRFDVAGRANGGYFFQDLWAARKIFAKRPARHVDIGSSIDGFIGHLLVFMERVEVVDIRPLPSTIPQLAFVQDDATILRRYPDDSLESVSTLHAAEHFGLGRYGDPVDPEAHLKFMRALTRVLKPGGRLYFSVPTGRERLEFNAHRVLAPATVLQAFRDLELVSFALVKDDQYLYENATIEEAALQSYGCGLYEFTKSQ